MKKIKILTAISTALLLGLTSCNKFLDVQPEDKLMREQIVVSEYATNSALNGIYLRMANNNLYGAYMTMTAVECLGQAYMAPNDQSLYYFLRDYQYTSTQAQSFLSTLWEQLYVQVLATNDFLDILDNLQYTMSERRMNMLRGEALALRAFYHFDIMRLWGPGPTTPEKSTDLCMVYNTNHEGKVEDMITEDSVMSCIIADLLEAERLLETSDPIREGGVIPSSQASGDIIGDFYQISRNYRMNYYAVKALQARVYLYGAGNGEDRREYYDKAKEAANAVLSEINGKGFFPWVVASAVTAGYNPDRIFSTEIIFGIHNRNMYTNYNSFFQPTLSVESELRPTKAWLDRFYDANGNDVRYSNIWLDAAGEKAGQKTCFKYAAPNLTNNPSNPIKAEYMQPLIKKSELYYILAECAAAGEGGPELAKAYLDTVRSHRGANLGALALADATAAHEAIEKEYRKDFFSEGHIWFYYKRRGVAQIPDAAATEANSNRAPVYRFPLPNNEIEARK